MPTSAKTIVVTGAHGFIGRHVARRAAADGAIVHGIGHGIWKPGEAAAWGISKWKGSDVELSSLESLALSPSEIFHCAGGSSVGASFENPWRDFDRTVASTSAVLEYARRATPVARVVLVSSAAVYGVCENVPISEAEAVRPISPYGNHKRLAEELGRSYSTQFGVPVSVVRLFSVYGAGLRKQLFWDACRKISAGKARFEGTGEEVRDWLHVEDAASLLLLAAKHADSSGPILNGASGEGVEVRKVLTELAVALGHRGEFSFSGNSLPGYPPRFVADVSRARALGFRASVSLSDGIRAYAEWFLKETV